MLTDDPPKVSFCSTWMVIHLSARPLAVSSAAWVCPDAGVVVAGGAVVVVGVAVTGTVVGVVGTVVGGTVVSTGGDVVVGTWVVVGAMNTGTVSRGPDAIVVLVLVVVVVAALVVLAVELAWGTSASVWPAEASVVLVGVVFGVVCSA